MESRAHDGVIATLWRYPVKSMNGEQVESAEIVEGGIVGDRGYALIDTSNGKVVSAKFPKKWGKLIGLDAAFTSEPSANTPLPPVRVTWPNGETATSGVDDLDARLTEIVERAVTMTTARPQEVSLERLDPLAEGEEILDIGELMMEGRFSDYAALHLITTSTLTRLGELRPESQFDARRFRPNIVVDTGAAAGFVENDWVGRTIALGKDVRIRISDPTPRCSIPTLAQAGLDKDPKVLRTIVEHNQLPVPLLDNEMLPCAGVYGFVLQGGTVRRGDPIHVT